MTTIKEDIIKFIEANGPRSKSQICDYLRDGKGTLGETTGRRIRELVKDGFIEKFDEELPISKKTYTAYRVVEVKEEPKYISDSEKLATAIWVEQKERLNL